MYLLCEGYHAQKQSTRLTPRIFTYLFSLSHSLFRARARASPLQDCVRRDDSLCIPTPVLHSLRGPGVLVGRTLKVNREQDDGSGLAHRGALQISTGRDLQGSAGCVTRCEYDAAVVGIAGDDIGLQSGSG